MSDFFAEATVRLRPDLTGFITELRTGVKGAIDAVETGPNPPSIKIRPALTRDFVGQLRRQATRAVDQVNARAAPIRTRPDLTTNFVAELRREVNAAITRVNERQTPIRVRPGLAAGFIGELRTEANKAIARADDGIRPIRVRPALVQAFVGELRRQANIAIDQASNVLRPLIVRAFVQAPTPRRVLADLQGAIQLPEAVPVPVQPVAAERTDIGPALADAERQTGLFAATQERLNALAAQGGKDLTALAAAYQEVGDSVEKARQRAQKQEQQSKESAGAADRESAAVQQLAKAEELAARAKIAGAGDPQRQRDIRAAEAARRTALVRATPGEQPAIESRAQVIQTDIAALEQEEKALKDAAITAEESARKKVEGSKKATKATIEETAAEKQLQKAEELTARARLADPGDAQRRRDLTEAEKARRLAIVRAGPGEKEAVAELAAEQKRALDELETQERKLSTTTASTVDSSRERVRGTKLLQVGLKDQLGTEKRLESVLLDLNAAENKELTTGTRARIVSSTQTEAAKIRTRAELELGRALGVVAAFQATRPTVALGALEAVGRQLTVIEQADRVIAQTTGSIDKETSAREKQRAAINAARKELAEQNREAARSNRSQEQLRRGAASTALSFLGIRGATLAASASFLAGAAALSVFAKALQNASEFNDQINVFRATAGATAEEMERVRQAARALGADIRLPGVTAADAATAMVELAKAGLDVQDSIDGARGVLQLATAAAIDNAQAVELAANALNAFELEGRDATRVADVFANAANAAQGSIVDIGIAFQQASAAGRQVGLSFEDTSTFLTILARSGLRGSDAGTSLRTALLRLIKPTERARDRLRELGVEVRDAQGNLRPDVFQQLTAATASLSPAARDATIALVGGQDAFRAISILGRQSIDEFIGLRKELRQQGTAAELAEARMEGLRGSLEALGNTLSTIGVRIGSGITPAIQGIVDGLTGASAAMAESDELARALGGSVQFLQTSMNALGATLTAIAPPLLFVANTFGVVANSVGVPTILAAVAAYKLLPPVLVRTTAALRSTAIANLAVAAAISPATFASAALSTSLTALAGSTGAITVGVAAVAAGLFFLATRESDAERATRHLKEATDDLASSLARAREASRQAAGLALSVSGAQLSVLEARQRADQAREALAGSRAGRGSFERRKLELQLAVAIDDVSAAQLRLRQAIEDSRDAQLESIEASRASREAREKERDALNEIAEGARREAGRRDLPQFSRAELETRAQQDFIKNLQERARAARETEDADQIRLAKRLELLARVAQAINGIPTQRAIDIVLDAESVRAALPQLANEFGKTGEDARKNFLRELSGAEFRSEFKRIQTQFRTLFAPFLTIAQQEGEISGDAFSRGVANAIASDKAKERVRQAAADLLSAALGRAQAQGAGLRREELDIEIAGGSDAERLANLQAQAAAAAREVAIRVRQQREGRIGFEQVTEAKERQAALIAEIRSIQDGMASDAKQAAEEAKDKQKERDQDLLDALGFGRDRAQEKIANAQATEGLRDDIRRTRELRQLVLKQIDTIKDRIKSAELRRDALRELGRITRDLAREIKQLQQQRNEELRERAAERNQLDIEFAQTTENRNAEIRAREREIARLKKLQDRTRRGTLEYRRLRNEIAEQQKAIRDLRKQEQEKNKDFESLQRLAFDFLQKQQGFAAGLISNLIPGELTAGLVGGLPGTTRTPQAKGADVGGGLRPGEKLPGLKGFGGGLAQSLVQDLKTRDDTGKLTGVSAGQGNVQIDLLRKILVEIRRANRSSDHPEGKQQRKTGSVALDYGGGTSMAM